MKPLPLLALLTPMSIAMTATTPAQAQPAARMLVSHVEAGPTANRLRVEITILHFQPSERTSPSADDLPHHLPAQLVSGGRRVAVTLDRETPVTATPSGAGTFGQATYGLALPAGIRAGDEIILSLLTGGTGSGYAFALPQAGAPAAIPAAAVPAPMPAPQQSAAIAAPPPLAEEAPSAKPDRGNAFLGNLSSYAPIYAAYGPGTDTDGKLQISFKYQLFGQAGAVGKGNPALNGIHFAFTQRMFWDLGGDSLPFRNIDFMPELFYLLPATSATGQLALGGQAGFRHESNGRDGLASRSINALYVQPIATMPVGDYTLSLGPRLSVFVGSLSDNPDIRKYRGNTALFAEIGQDDGLRLTTNTRFNIGSGKGAIDADLSYPLDRIIHSSLNLYVFGQGFAGYGENLLDYDRKVTRLRVGIAIVR